MIMRFKLDSGALTTDSPIPSDTSGPTYTQKLDSDSATRYRNGYFLGESMNSMTASLIAKSLSAQYGHGYELQVDGYTYSNEAGKQSQDYPIVALILYCPACHARHIDQGEFATKPHHTHACQSCGIVWRPAVVNTVGVQFLPGFKDAFIHAPSVGTLECDGCKAKVFVTNNGLCAKCSEYNLRGK